MKSFFKCFLLAFGASPVFFSIQPSRGQSLPISDYFSPEADEVDLVLRGSFYVPPEKLVGSREETMSLLNGDLQRMFQFLAGPMSTGPVPGSYKYKTKPKITGFELSSGQVQFEYSDLAVLWKSQSRELEIYLPKDLIPYGSIVDAFYQRSLNPQGRDAREQNPCMDSYGYYLELDHFWYFWNPRLSKCPLGRKQENGEYAHIFSSRAAIHPRKQATEPRYPDYPRLRQNGGPITISIVYGADLDENGQKPPEDNPDVNAKSYQEVAEHLEDQGFTRKRLNSAELQSFCAKAGESPNQVVDTFIRKDKDSGIELMVKMLWGTTTIKPYSQLFACFVNEAFAKSSVFIYNAHSNLGNSVYSDNLRLMSDLPILVNRDIYQLYVFNSCSSYRYYNEDYFVAKRSASDPEGTKNLQVITNAGPGNFSFMTQSTTNIIDPIVLWSKQNKWTSYQEILTKIVQRPKRGSSQTPKPDQLDHTQALEGWKAIDRPSLTGVNGLLSAPAQPY